MEASEKTVKKAIRGNVNAYGELINYYKEYLYRTAMLYLKNEDDALDAVSECVLRGFRNIKKVKKPEYFKTWLTRILIHVIYDMSKEQTNAADIDEMEPAEQEKEPAREERMDLYHAIDRLRDKYKTVIVLKYFLELTLREIAEVMDIPEGSVAVYLTRAKRELRGYLKEDYYG